MTQILDPDFKIRVIRVLDLPKLNPQTIVSGSIVRIV